MSAAIIAAALSGSAAPPAPTFTYRGHFEDPTLQSAYSFADVPIGDAAADRSVKVAVWSFSSLAVSMSAPVIGGVTATAVVPQSGTPTRHLTIYEAVVPAGTTATIAVTFSDNTLRCGIAVWTSTGLPTTYASRSGSTTTAGGVTNSITLTALTVPTGGYGIAVGWLGTTAGGPPTVTQTTGSNTIRMNEQLGSAALWMVAADTDAAGSQAFTIDGADAVQYLAAAAAWG